MEDEIEIQYQNEKRAIQEELEIELSKNEFYSQRAKELYAQLRELNSWYKENKETQK